MLTKRHEVTVHTHVYGTKNYLRVVDLGSLES